MWRGRSGSERGSAMEVEVEKREREVEGKIGWRDGRHRRSLELLEMKDMVGEVRFCSFVVKIRGLLGFKTHPLCLLVFFFL